MFIGIRRDNFNPFCNKKLCYCNSYIFLNSLSSFFTHILSFFIHQIFNSYKNNSCAKKILGNEKKNELLICSALISSNKHSYVKPFHFSFYDICNFSPFTLLAKAAQNGAKANMKSHLILYTYAISRDFFGNFSYLWTYCKAVLSVRKQMT